MTILFPGLYIVLFNTLMWKGNRPLDIISLIIGHKAHCVFQNLFQNRRISGQIFFFWSINSCNSWTQLIIYESICVSSPQGHTWSTLTICMSEVCNGLTHHNLTRFTVKVIYFTGNCLSVVQEVTVVSPIYRTRYRRKLKQPGSWNSCTDKTSPTHNPVEQLQEIFPLLFHSICCLNL